jgi:predicted P-loop ATPase
MSAALNYSHHWGGPLTESDYQSLAGRWITRELAHQCGIRRVDSITGRAMFGRKHGNLAGLIIPNVAPWDSHSRNYRLRLDEPDLQYQSDGTIREANKYLQAPEARNTLYFPAGVTEAALTDTTLPIIIVEGEFKSIALWRLATHQTDSPRFLPIAVSGVWNWRGVVGKHNGPNGERRDVKGPIPDLGHIGWKGRNAIIAFDADSETNESVRAARSQLTAELLEWGATVAFLEWPADQGKGIDDRLAAIGPERVLADIAAIEYGGWKSRLLRSDSGKLLAAHANVALYLQNDPVWVGVLGYDEFAGRVCVLRQPPAPVNATPGTELDDHFDTEAAQWFENRGMRVKPDLVRRVIDSVSRRNRFHPVRQYLESLKWDGRQRIGTWLINYCGVPSSDSDPNDYAMAVGEKFLISAVARVFQPGCKVDTMLVFEGNQGTKKSTAASILAGERWFTDQIRELGSKDTSMQLQGAWIVEMGELASLSRAEVEQQKAFISQQRERFRPPYGHRVIDVPRQCVFIGTTNKGDWLKDETGGRRFWPVRCGAIDLEGIARDRDQLWAEAVVRYRAGEKWWLEGDMEQQAKEEQNARLQEDPWHKKVIEYAEEAGETRGSASIPDILSRLGMETSRHDQVAQNRVSRCLVAEGWERAKMGPRGAREWRYRKAVSQS